LASYVDRIVDKLDNRVTLDERLRALLEYVGAPAQTLLGGADGCERWLGLTRSDGQGRCGVRLPGVGLAAG